jgi:hypothetical protein
MLESGANSLYLPAMFRTGAQFMILVLLAGLALLRESRHGELAAWDDAFADFLAINSRPGATHAPVTLVEINDSSLKRINQWPWNPLDYSRFFEAVLPVKPEVVAIDQVLDWERAIVLTEEEQVRRLPQYQNMLRNNILRAPKLLLGAELGVPEDPQVVPEVQPVPLLRRVSGPLRDIPEFTVVEQQPSEGFRLSSTTGFVNLPETPDRSNSVPLLFRYRGQVTPAFALQAVMLWAQLTPDDVVVDSGSHIALGSKLRIPIDATGRMRVNFGVPRGSLDYEELMLASEQKEAGKVIAPLEQMKSSIVLLSRTDKDARIIPLAARRHGSPGELFAAAIATIQNQSFIQPAPLWAQYAVIAAFMLFGYGVPRWKKLQTVLRSLVALAAYVMIALAVFSKWLVWLPGVMPLGAVAVCILFRAVTPDSFGRPKKPVIF